MPKSSSRLKQKWVESYVLRREANARTRRVGRLRGTAGERPRETPYPTGSSFPLLRLREPRRRPARRPEARTPFDAGSAVLGEQDPKRPQGPFLPGDRPCYQLRDRALDNILETGCNS